MNDCQQGSQKYLTCYTMSNKRVENSKAASLAFGLIYLGRKTTNFTIPVSTPHLQHPSSLKDEEWWDYIELRLFSVLYLVVELCVPLELMIKYVLVLEPSWTWSSSSGNSISILRSCVVEFDKVSGKLNCSHWEWIYLNILIYYSQREYFLS